MNESAKEVVYATVELRMLRQLPSAGSLAADLVEFGMFTQVAEQVWIVTYDDMAQRRSIVPVAIGEQNTVRVDLPTLFQAVWAAGSHRFFLIHNHPTGHVEPTNADVALTKQVQLAASMGGVTLEDHLVIGPPDRMWSMSEHGQLQAMSGSMPSRPAPQEGATRGGAELAVASGTDAMAELRAAFARVFASATGLVNRYPGAWFAEANLYAEPGIAFWSADLEVIFGPNQVESAFGEGASPLEALDSLAKHLATMVRPDSATDPRRALDSLGAHWQRIAAELPQGWQLSIWGPNRSYDRPYAADALAPGGKRKIRGMGFSPHEALTELHAHLVAERAQ